jgi:hypothetical protein
MRRRLVANTHIASLLGMHYEEYLTRIANNDLALPCTELDGLILFLFMTIRDTFSASSTHETYFRMCSGSGQARRVFLVLSRCIISRTHSSADSQVTHSYHSCLRTPA